MNTYKDDPIHPVPGDIARTMALPYDAHPGLTKREYFAALMMQAMISQPPTQTLAHKPDTVAGRAVAYADALIGALQAA